MATKASAVFLVIICTFMTSYAHVLWKIVSSRPFHDILISWELWGGFAILAVAAGILITAFKHGDVSVLFPVVATSYIWVTLLSYHYFAEPITAYKWVGVAGIVIGLTVLGKGNKLAEAPHGH
jgi:drug/metabolite transporter (DMT)-like permease